MTTITADPKEIRYDRESRDYAMYYAGELIGFARTYHEAEVELDRYVFELLQDTAVVTADMAAEQAAEASTEAPLLIGFDGANVPPAPPLVALASADDDDCPDHGPYADDDCPKCRAKLQIDDTSDDATWGSKAPKPLPESWKDRALGLELLRMRWRSYRAFVDLLLSLPAAHLRIYAACYVACIQSYAPESDLTADHVLRVWGQMMARGGSRGPAAPSMRWAA